MPDRPVVSAPTDETARRQYVLVSSPIDGQLCCERPAGHKGAHRLSRADEQESSAMWARWMMRALARREARDDG